MKFKSFLLFVVVFLMILSLGGCSGGKEEQAVSSSSSSSAVQVLNAPDTELLGGWIFKNPDDETELLVFEFGPDSTAVIMQYKGEEMVGEKLTARCQYMLVKGVRAIEITLDNTTQMNYFYKIEGKSALFTDADTGDQMLLYKVVEPELG